jgi:hypothetical protein
VLLQHQRVGVGRVGNHQDLQQQQQQQQQHEGTE